MGWLLITILFVSLILGLIVLAVSTTDGSLPLREAPPEPASSGGIPLWRSSYLESSQGRKFSCSFVEFDERGDYLKFSQHVHCWRTLEKLGRDSAVLLVIYCHGWKNNAQSGDVLKFNEFLGTLARSSPVQSRGLRVHGVYLSWRGARLKPVVSGAESDTLTRHYFDEPIVDSDQHNKFPVFTAPFAQLTYWNRRKAAEHRVSGLPIARSVFSYASTVAKLGEQNHHNSRVVLMGHSFGALLLERSVSEASVGSIVTQWPWFTKQSRKGMRDFLPFDLVLFVNSAAPSIYAKMLRDLADAHDSAREETQRPLFVSLTSKADRATGFLHPLANWFAPLDPTLNRFYTHQVFEDEEADPPVGQGAFYMRTPGHNKFLISHRLAPAERRLLPDLSTGEIFERNLTTSTGGTFLTRAGASSLPLEWSIEAIESVEYEGRDYHPLKSAYWIMQCEHDLIHHHNDIWNERAMQAYAAIFGISEALH